ncbi:MAG: YfhO family protein [Candidatus Rokubacteria bacterium]|nr:YfhO family protein [Candidatus Rokubacteria bacterium]
MTKALPLVGYLLVLIVFFFPVTFGAGSLSPAPYLPGTMPWGPAGSYAPAVRQAMLGRQPFIDPAPAWTSEPWAFTIGAMYRAGEPPLWNPHQGLGVPLAANMQSQALYPPRVPLFLAPGVEPWNAYHLLRPIVGGFFTYRFLRLLVVSRASAFAGGLAFMLTGHVVLYLTMWHLDTELLVPALMWLTEKVFRARSVRAAVALGLALALAALAGAPESLVLIALFVTAYYAFRTVAVGLRARRLVPALVEYGRYFAGAAVVSLAVASPLLVLFLEYMWQGHAPAHTPRDNIGVWGVPLTGAVSLIVPYFFDHLRFQPMLPAPVGVYGLSNYLGVLPVALALLAPRRRVTLFFAAYSAVALLKTYGVNPVNLLGHLPLLERIIFYKYNQPVIAFGVVVLMAITADTLPARVRSARFRRRAVLTVAALGAAIALSLAYHRAWIARTSPTTWEQVFVAVHFLLVVLALVWAGSRWARAAAAIPVAAAVVVAVELFLYLPKALPPLIEPFAPPRFVEFLRGDAGLFRVYGLEGVLYPNTAGAYGLSDIRALDAMYPSGYLPLVRASLRPEARGEFIGSSGPGALRHRALLDLMNVKYLLSMTRLREADLTHGWRLVYDDEIRIYENPTVLPRAFVVHAVDVASSRDDALARLLAPGFDPRARVILEERPDGPAPAAPAPGATGSVDVIAYGAQRVTVRARLGAPGMLVLGDTFYPGWTATVDGRAATIHRANFLVRAVAVDAGPHEIEFAYRPARFYVASAISLAVVALALVAAARRPRR